MIYDCHTKPPVSCQLTGTSASLPIKWKAKCPGQQGGVAGVSGGRRGRALPINSFATTTQRASVHGYAYKR